MPTLEILMGLSGSGKSTYAENTGKAIVSRDALRVAIFGDDGPNYYEHPQVRTREDAVTIAEHAAIAGALSVGLDVVHDATNLTTRFTQKIANIGYSHGAEVKIKVFDVPLETALERNRKRGLMGGRLVPEDVIRKQHGRLQNSKNWKPKKPFEPVSYVPNDDLPMAYMVDIDGTLAHMHNRGPFDWKRVGEDNIDYAVANTIEALYTQGYTIIVMSGRDGSCRQETEDWLSLHGVPYHELHMRAADDMRADDIIKHELFDEHVRDYYHVMGVFDDRKRVVDMWKKMGLKVFNVSGLDNGDF